MQSFPQTKKFVVMADRRRRSSAFTLVELLVVIGIIALLISILLPALNRARQASQVTVCLSNMRQLAVAVAAYASSNKNTLPEAVMSNTTGRPGPLASSAPSGSPINYTSPAGTGTILVMPSIGEALQPYLGKGDAVWKCPNGNDSINLPADAYISEGPDPIAGFATGNRWQPNYYYMNTKWSIITGSFRPTVLFAGAAPIRPLIAGYPAGDWFVRNVAGLKTNQARSASGQTSSRIVVFVEWKSRFHTSTTKDVYALAAGEKYSYLGNFAYLDGHAETQRYKTLNGYMAQLHDPIRQKWYGVDFALRYPEYYSQDAFFRQAAGD
jgi:prepilin-type N-terminal cleavage/methylation domain-containing protein/prepilin-type processing-associated H-X9-DG protein